ncbi:hypothetical protein [Microvirga pudoricolor]|uniref:hypothetical protein n=1 Tax=Microvirga pudoricolor TaxID=2778729 RepID=UPI00194F95CD|nr:hypothetical protein [Microvirga pudoricolor]MBM6595579.1 hypothetical protein [Microvirga pudoricolor]
MSTQFRPTADVVELPTVEVPRSTWEEAQDFMIRANVAPRFFFAGRDKVVMGFDALEDATLVSMAFSYELA